MRRSLQLPRREERGRRGAALIIALALILALTALVVCSRVQAVTQLAESRSQRDYERALQLAEAGLNAYLFGLNGGAGAFVPASNVLLGGTQEYSVAQFQSAVRAGTISHTTNPALILYPGGGLNEGYFVQEIDSASNGFLYSFGWCNGVARRIRAVTSQSGIVDSAILASSGAGMTISGGASVTFGGTVHVNSPSSTAVVVSGSNTRLNINSPGVLDITGNTGTPAGITGTWNHGVAAVTDPLAALPVPSTAGMTNFASGTFNGGTVTLNPGHYPSIVLQGTGNYTLNPGLYYVDSGFSLSGGSSLTGVGVTIYNNDTPNNKGITISGGAPVNLSPPTSGTYAGIMLFQNRTSPSTVQITGGSGFNMSGAIYAAGSPLVLSGGSGLTSPIASTVIAKTMTVSGGGNFAVIPKNGRWTVNTSASSSGTQWTELAN